MTNNKCYQKAMKIYQPSPVLGTYGLVNDINFINGLCDKANIKEAVRIKNTYSEQEIKSYITEISLDINKYPEMINNWDQQQKAVKNNRKINTEIEILEAIINNTEIPSITMRHKMFNHETGGFFIKF